MKFIQSSTAMILEPLHCPNCNGTDVIKHGMSAAGKQRYRCQNPECEKKTFIRDYSYQAYLPQVKQKISNMAMNGSGIRDEFCAVQSAATMVMVDN